MSSLINGSFCHPSVNHIIRIEGPIVGGAFPDGEHAPLAIAEEYYRTICEGRKRVLDREEIHKEIASSMVDPITKGWVQKLSTVDDQCVEAAPGRDGGIYTWM